MSPSRPTRRAALTLVEVAVSLGVFSILVLGLMAAMSAGLGHAHVTREHQAASEAAQTELDLAMAQPYDAISNIQKPFPVRYALGTVDVNGIPITALVKPARSTFYPVDASAPTFAGHVTSVRDPDANGSVDLLELRVVVAFRGADDTDYRVDLVARRTRD